MQLLMAVKRNPAAHCLLSLESCNLFLSKSVLIPRCMSVSITLNFGASRLVSHTFFSTLTPFLTSFLLPAIPPITSQLGLQITASSHSFAPRECWGNFTAPASGPFAGPCRPRNQSYRRFAPFWNSPPLISLVTGLSSGSTSHSTCFGIIKTGQRWWVRLSKATFWSELGSVASQLAPQPWSFLCLWGQRWSCGTP